MNPKAETIINESDIGDVFESLYSTIIARKQKHLGQGSSWITDSVIDHNNDDRDDELFSWYG